MTRILGYALVSPAEREQPRYRDTLSRAGAGHVFEDDLLDRTIPRPGLTELMACARAGDTVVVPWIDHLGRSLPEVVQAVTEFRDRGLCFRTMNDRLDTSSSPDVFDVFAALHAFERRRNGRLVRAGMAAAETSGRRPGRPGADPAKIAEAMRLADAGLGVTKAAKQAGVGRSTLYKEMARRRTLPRSPNGGI